MIITSDIFQSLLPYQYTEMDLDTIPSDDCQPFIEDISAPHMLTLNAISKQLQSQPLDSNIPLASNYQQEIVLDELILIIRLCSNLAQKKKAAEHLGTIAANFVRLNQSCRNSVLEKILILNKEDTSSLSLYALKQLVLLTEVFFNEFKQSLGVHLEAEDKKHKLQALDCLVVFLTQANRDKIKQFGDLYELVLKALISLTDQQNGEETFSIFQKLIQNNFLFRKKSPECIFQLLKIPFNQIIKRGVRIQSLNILKQIIEKSPSVFRKNISFIREMMSNIANLLGQISPQTPSNWAYTESADEEMGEDIALTNTCVETIDKILQRVGGQEVLPILEQLVRGLVNSEDWRSQHAAIMMFSIVGEYVGYSDDITADITTILSFFRNQHPRLRYAACHAIGLIFNYAKPAENIQLARAILSELQALLQNDPVPRIVAHAAAALTNFIEEIDYQILAGSLDILVPRLIDLIAYGFHETKMGSLSAISSIVEVAKQNYQPYLQRTNNVLFLCLNSDEKVQKSLVIRRLCIETMSIMAKNIGDQLFRTFMGQCIQRFIVIQEQMLQNSKAQQMKYIFQGWQRLFVKHTERMGPNIINIFPVLLKLIRKYLNQEKQDIPSIENVFDLVYQLVSQYPTYFQPFVTQTLIFLVNNVQTAQIHTIKAGSCKCISAMIEKYCLNQSEESAKIIKRFTKYLLQLVQRQQSLSSIHIYVQTCENIFRISSLFSEEEIVWLLQKWMRILIKMNDCVINPIDEELNEDQQIKFDKEIEQRLQVQTASSKMITILWNAHTNLTLQFTHKLQQQILPYAFKEGQTKPVILFCLDFTNAIIERYGYSPFSNQWENFAAFFARFAKSDQANLKQASCRGIGSLVKSTPSALLSKQVVSSWLDLLFDTRDSCDTNYDKANRHCSDNILGAIARIIVAHCSYFDLKSHFLRWLYFLPLRNDFAEANHQIEILARTVCYYQMMDGGNQIRNCQKLLNIYGHILRCRQTYKKPIRDIIYGSMNYLLFQTSLDESLGSAWNNIVNVYQQVIRGLMV